MTNDPETIRRDIERTRDELSEDVDAVRERLSPRRAARRQTRRMRTTMAGMKDRVMGVVSDVESAGGSAVSTMGDAASEAPAIARRRTEGNPLAAGLISFGLGWLVATVIPATRQEREAAQALKERAGGLTDEVSGMARQVAEDLKEPAQEAVESVKTSAAEAARTVREEGSSATGDVHQQAEESARSLRDSS
ncbi:MAG TPA: DUF3618 domain-containing protein [Jiangellaceae bacterium]